MNRTHDVAIVGGGIVGLATAISLSSRFPGRSIVVLEKEGAVAAHQTGHNSGVIHAGIYYKPGSYKARLCVEGARRMFAFCDENGVRYDRCGKLIVAVDETEIPRLESIFERGKANDVPGLVMLGAAQAREIEPHARAVRAIHSPSTAIVDFREVAEAMASHLARIGVEVRLSSAVRSIARSNGELRIESGSGTVAARNLINCAGLHSDRIARLMGLEPGTMILPFRGEYYELPPDTPLVRGLIYPVPDPRYPFLGVHFTKRVHGGYEAGPNAVLALAREGYARTSVGWGDLAQMAGYRGFWAMASKHWRMGFYEYYRSLSRGAFRRALQRLVPELRDSDLRPGGSGVRAQSVTPDGGLVDDFQIREVPNAIHVLNAPSPAATASLAIGDHICARAASVFGLQG